MEWSYSKRSCPLLILTFHIGVALLTNVLLVSTVLANPSRTNKDLDKASTFIYPAGIFNETQLPNCTSLNSPCNLIQNPFFFPFKVHRLCNCPNKLICPYDFEVKRKLDTVFLNNREQVKFCIDLPKCTVDQDSTLEVSSNRIPINLNCFCPKKRHWTKLETLKNGNGSYKCERIKPCENDCGLVRQDNYATYFQCSCPPKELCMPYNRTKWFEAVSYSGPGFMSRCGVP